MANNEPAKKLLDRIKKLTENLIDETKGDYNQDALFLYSLASGMLQKIELDEEDALKDQEEDYHQKKR